MSTVHNVSRREFVKGMFSAGAFVLCGQLAPIRLWAGSPDPSPDRVAATPFRPSIWLGMEPDGSVIIVASRSEMGSGSRTGPAIVLADELEADWKRVCIEQALGDAKYGGQDTDGSHSIRDLFDVMRQAGATARTMLEQAAAQQWKVPASECKANLHTVTHQPTGRSLGYGELVAVAATLPVPVKESLKFKPRAPISTRFLPSPMGSFLRTVTAVAGLISPRIVAQFVHNRSKGPLDCCRLPRNECIFV